MLMDSLLLLVMLVLCQLSLWTIGCLNISTNATSSQTFSEHLLLWIPEYIIESEDLEAILSIDGQRPPNVNSKGIESVMDTNLDGDLDCTFHI